MRESILVKRYAEAYVAAERGTLGLRRIIEEFKQLKFLIHDNREFIDFLKSHGVGFSEAGSFIDVVLKDFSGELRKFLKYLLEKERVWLIEGIADYVRVQYERSEAQDAVLNVSSVLDIELIARIKERLEQKFDRKLNLFIGLDASLLGGAQARVGSKFIDGSVRRRLDELRERLRQAVL